MSLINSVLKNFGMRLTYVNNPLHGPKRNLYLDQLKLAQSNSRFRLIGSNIRDESGAHPQRLETYQCAFGSAQIAAIKPPSILDIGSIRYWQLGVMAHYRVTTLDIRPRDPLLPNETVLTCDARALDFANGMFDMVACLHTIGIIGLGRYGDPFDNDGDLSALAEMKRVIKPGGHLILTMPFSLAEPFIYFNVRRYYDAKQISSMTSDLQLVAEEYYSWKKNAPCSRTEMALVPNVPIEEQYNMYFGCWRKPL